MTDNKITLMIAEDHPFYREGVKLNLTRNTNLVFIGEATNGLELMKLLQIKQPAIILMDIRMDGLDGIQATKIINTEYPQTKVIALTSYDDDDCIIKMYKAGASGYLLKNADRSEMLDVINTVNEGKRANDKITHQKMLNILSHTHNAFKKENTIHELSYVEMEIIRLVCKSLTVKEIGLRMKMSERTIEGYKSRIMTKFEVRNTTGMVLFAIKHKIVQIEDLM